MLLIDCNYYCCYTTAYFSRGLALKNAQSCFSFFPLFLSLISIDSSSSSSIAQSSLPAAIISFFIYVYYFLKYLLLYKISHFYKLDMCIGKVCFGCMKIYICKKKSWPLSIITALKMLQESFSARVH